MLRFAVERLPARSFAMIVILTRKDLRRLSARRKDLTFERESFSLTLVRLFAAKEPRARATPSDLLARGRAMRAVAVNEHGSSHRRRTITPRLRTTRCRLRVRMLTTGGR